MLIRHTHETCSVAHTQVRLTLLPRRSVTGDAVTVIIDVVEDIIL